MGFNRSHSDKPGEAYRFQSLDNGSVAHLGLGFRVSGLGFRVKGRLYVSITWPCNAADVCLLKPWRLRSEDAEAYRFQQKRIGGGRGEGEGGLVFF